MKLGIYVEDFKIYFELVNELKRRNIEFIDLHQDGHENVAVVLTDREMNFRNQIVIGNVRRSVRRSVSYIYGKKRFSEMIVGIDPGLRTGIVVIADGIQVEEMETSNIEEIKNILISIRDDYDPLSMTVRIGMGDIPDRNKIINEIYGYFDIEIVDESGTTPIKNRNIEAARKIAMKRGEKVKGKMELRFKEGEIVEIQRRSRILSDNRITISKKLAIKVLKGEMDIKNAIEVQKK